MIKRSGLEFWVKYILVSPLLTESKSLTIYETSFPHLIFEIIILKVVMKIK